MILLRRLSPTFAPNPFALSRCRAAGEVPYRSAEVLRYGASAFGFNSIQDERSLENK